MSEKINLLVLQKILPNDDILSQCIHCGMCLATCPTYELTKLERSSPRGRIRLINALAKSEIELTDTFVYEMNFCLDCQACETACPAGVKYGSMVEAAREVISESEYGASFSNKFKKFLLRNILASQPKLKFVSKLLFIYQSFGIKKFLHSIGFFKLLSPKLGEVDKLSPEVSKTFSSNIFQERIKPKGEIKYKIAFLTGCLMDVMFAEINKDTVDVLTLCNCEVINPKNQVCCGSLHAHNGDIETAIKLAKKNVDEFGKFDYDFLVSNSAGCGAFMKEYGHVLQNDFNYSEKAKLFSEKVKDITEFLSDILPEITFHNVEGSFTYHDACHLAHTQKVTNQPRKVLNSIPGIELNNLEESTWCCGSAGIYNIVHYDDSMKMLERKMENIRKTNSSTVLTGNPGCISQIKYGAKKFNVNVEVFHPVTIIKRALLNSNKK